MDQRERLLAAQSMHGARQLALEIGDDPVQFDALARLFLQRDARLAQCASYTLMHCSNAHPELALPYLRSFLDHARNPPHISVRRNVVRLLQLIDIPAELEGPVYDLCWQFAHDRKEAIAVRVFSLSVIASIAERYPELAPEVIDMARELAAAGSPGLRNRAGKVLKQLGSLTRRQ
ncbi:MAG: hypothetical protein R3301_05820 [Saprospiraceae bacterium]|nr:hypothetical protein [Saprospiraceae bacterium]